MQKSNKICLSFYEIPQLSWHYSLCFVLGLLSVILVALGPLELLDRQEILDPQAYVVHQDVLPLGAKNKLQIFYIWLFWFVIRSHQLAKSMYYYHRDRYNKCWKTYGDAGDWSLAKRFLPSFSYHLFSAFAYD